MNSITNKTQAHDYLYDVFQANVIKDNNLFEQAKSFFTKRELECMDLEPVILINSCFSATAKKCGCVVK